MPLLTRRRFIGSGLALAAGSLTRPRAHGAQARPAPSQRITLGVIGCGNQGMNDIHSFLQDARVQIVAVCDVNRESSDYWARRPGGREVARRVVEAHEAQFLRSQGYRGCAVYPDYRDMIARRDIDAVLIATPDHWHCLHTVDAARAGKDIYCQKPLSLTIDEGRLMRDIVRHHQRVFQTGSQQRSAASFIRAVNLVRNGYIGKVREVRVGLPGGRPDHAQNGEQKQPVPVPAGFDYDTWLGPAPEAVYAPARCHVNFRWIYDYAGGQVTDWGAHHVDCAMWGAGVDHTGPYMIRNHGAEFPPDPLWNTATTFHFEAAFAGGLRIDVSDRFEGGVTYIGTDGWIWAGRGSIKASNPKLVDIPLKQTDELTYASRDHFRNFIDCVIARKDPAAAIELAHRTNTVCHLGNIAFRLGRERLLWDPVQERVLDDAAAHAMLRRPYRSPWPYPQI